MSTISKISITGNQLIINYKGPVVSKYRGVNFSAYDNGNLSNSGQDGESPYAPHGLCTDNTPGNGSIGGWLDNSNNVISPKPNADGNTNYPPAFTVGGSFGYLNKGSPLNNLTRIENVQGKTDYGWSTAYPSPAQITNAIDHGINIIRLPFMPAFMDNIATGWAKSQNDIYMIPNKDYLNYYMTSFNFALGLIKEKNNGVIILDNHSYQRWCPTNEPGTFSCLEPSEPNFFQGKTIPSRRYSMNETTDKMCPYKLSEKGITDFKSYGLKPGWGQIDYSYIQGNNSSKNALTKGNVSNYFCLHATSSENNSSQSPTSNEYELDPDGCKSTTKSDNACYGGPTKRIIGIDCMPVLWYNILESEFSIIDKGGNAKLYGTVGKYLMDNKDNIWIDIMNEPNEVNNRDIGTAIAKTIKMLRKYGIQNKLMIEGNYWSGAHAQICPYEETKKFDDGTEITRPDGSGEGWYYPQDDPKGCAGISKGNGYKGAPIQIIHDEIKKENPSKAELGDIVYNVHQYMDKNSTGGHNCVGCNDNGVTTLEQMQFVTGFDKLNDWAEYNGVQLFASEFGAPIGCNSTCAGCNQKLNLFVEMLEKYDTVLGWTIWRAPPTTTWVSDLISASRILDSPNCENNSRARIGNRWTMGSSIDSGLSSNPPLTCPGDTGENGCGNYTYPWTNSMIFADKGGNLNKGNLTVLLNSDCNCNGWQSMYDNNKGMTDKHSLTFCMPRLWELNGGSSKGQQALTYCENFAKGQHEVIVEPIIESPDEPSYYN